MQNALVMIPVVPVDLYCFCVFEIFVTDAKMESFELFHIPHSSINMVIPLSTPAGSHHGPTCMKLVRMWNRLGILCVTQVFTILTNNSADANKAWAIQWVLEVKQNKG